MNLPAGWNERVPQPALSGEVLFKGVTELGDGAPRSLEVPGVHHPHAVGVVLPLELQAAVQIEVG